MKILKKLQSYFLADPASLVAEPEILPVETLKTASLTSYKTDSLAYLAYKYRKQKGLTNRDNCDRPMVFFGDEWAF